MSDRKLELAPDLHVPRKIAAATNFITGTKGSGKTYTAGVLAEELLAAGVHTLILDPLGVWWGLRHDKSGGAGGFPILILGGEHGDVPLHADKGEIVAEFVVRTGQSAILDMSGFDSDAEQDRFVTALLKKLFRLKATDKANLHLIMDEADMFAPQSPQPGQQVMLGASKTIVTKGRSRGLSMTMLTQRPQSISTSVRDEADVFICHRILGPRGRDAVMTWVEQHAEPGQAKEFAATLATLKNGEGWVWSPQFLKLFERHRFREKRTFDSSRTPDPGESVRKPKASASVDLEKLTAEMRATLEEAKANDPKELKGRIAQLERELKTRPVPTAGSGKVAETSSKKDLQTIARLRAGLEQAMKIIAEINSQGFDAVGVDPEQVKKAVEAAAAQIVKMAEQNLTKKAAEFEKLKKDANRILGQLQKLLNDEDVNVRVDVKHNEPFTMKPARAASPTRTFASSSRGSGVVDDAPQWMQPAHQRLLDSLAWLSTFGVSEADRSIVAAVAGASPKSSSYTNNLGRLSAEGLILYPRQGLVALTDDGAKLARGPESAPTLEDLHNAWRSCPAFDPAHVRILNVVIERYPDETSREDVAESAGASPTSSSFTNNLGRLSSMGLITYPRKGFVKASELLFPAALRDLQVA